MLSDVEDGLKRCDPGSLNFILVETSLELELREYSVHILQRCPERRNEFTARNHFSLIELILPDTRIGLPTQAADNPLPGVAGDM